MKGVEQARIRALTASTNRLAGAHGVVLPHCAATSPAAVASTRDPAALVQRRSEAVAHVRQTLGSCHSSMNLTKEQRRARFVIALGRPLAQALPFSLVCRRGATVRKRP